MERSPPATLLILAAILTVAGGCDDENSRVARVALEAAQQQAAQNQEIERVNREVAEGNRRLIEGRAQADQQWQSMQQDLDGQRSQLEAERRSQNLARRRESLLAPVLNTLGVLVVCGLPLLLCWQLLVGLGKQSQDAAITEVLIEELIDPAASADLPDHFLSGARPSEAAGMHSEPQTRRLPGGPSDRAS